MSNDGACKPRRSGASGYLLPLSGGADSASTAAIVGAMCQVGFMNNWNNYDSASTATIVGAMCQIGFIGEDINIWNKIDSASTAAIVGAICQVGFLEEFINGCNN